MLTTQHPDGDSPLRSTPPSSLESPPSYPLRFSVDYPDRGLNRLTSALRIFWILPIALVLLGPGSVVLSSSPDLAATIGSGTFGPHISIGLMLLFFGKYPRWCFDFSVELLRLQARVSMYAALATDVYPATDEHQTVHLDADYPNVERDLNTWLPLVKWLLALPHYLALFVLWIGVILVTIYVWFAILLTERYPRSCFDYIVGVHRWGYRVVAYAFLLNTDVYPPFSLEERW